MSEGPARPPMNRATRFVIIGGAALLVVAIGGALLDGGSSGAPATDSTPAAASALSTPAGSSPAPTSPAAAPTAPPVVMEPSTPMNTSEPFHELPDADDWRAWLRDNEGDFARARSSLSAQLADGVGPGADRAEYEEWTSAMLSRPIPADPIGRKLTDSLAALREAARLSKGGATDAAAVQARDVATVKGYTLLQTALSELVALDVLEPA